jgi:RES domain-containing protein
VYASTHLSLAALEYLVHVSPATAPSDLMSIEIDVSGLAVEAWDRASLPPGWDADPAPATTQKRGSAWAGMRSAPLLRVPSALLPAAMDPHEANVLLNPHHPEAVQARIVHVEPFRLARWLEAWGGASFI